MKLSWPIIVGVGIVTVGAIAAGLFLRNLGESQGYSPEQPIPFSHELHAGQHEIPCQYCHSGVDKSRHATIPSMDTCLNCHSVVKTDSKHIQEIQNLYDKGEAVEWVKVHDMPDHVMFNHQRHIARGVDCSQCHGDVATMPKIEQVKPLNMGFCINCHREHEASLTCETCHQ